MGDYKGYIHREFYSKEENEARERLDKVDLLPLLEEYSKHDIFELMEAIEEKYGDGFLEEIYSSDDFGDYLIDRYGKRLTRSESVTTYISIN
jgi:hypothetical protein